MGGVTRAGRALGLALGLTVGLPACSNTLSDAQIAYDAGEYEEAERLYNQTIAEGKEVDQEIAREELFEMHLEQGAELKKKPKQSEEHFRKALALDAASAEAREGLAHALIALYRHDEALTVVMEGVKRGDCKPCERMYAVIVLQRADNEANAADWEGAERDYAEAFALLPDAAVALALGRARLNLGNIDGTVEVLRRAAPMIGADSADQRATFLELRRLTVLACIEKEKIDLADELLDLAPIGVTGEEQLGLAIEVAMEFSRVGKPAEALSRMQALVGAADQGKMQITEARRVELRDRVADLLASRAAMSLANGDTAGARTDIDDALKLRPTNTRAQLQNVLLLAGEGKLSAGKAQLAKVDAKVVGRTQVDAILRAMEVDKLLADGRTPDAARELDAARAIDPDVPEVHVAEAQLLSVTAAAGVSKKEAKALQTGLVRYPGEVTRVGEALSELAWARKQIGGQGDVYPFRAPNTIKRMTDLEDKLKAYYPFVVEFQPDPVAILVVSGKAGGAVSVAIKGAGVDTTVEAPAGGSSEVKVDSPGPLTLSYGGAAQGFLAEPYTKVQLAL